MKKLRNIINRSSLVSTAAGVMLATALAITFWFATAPKASAGDCVLCHKHTLTITVVCGSSTIITGTSITGIRLALASLRPVINKDRLATLRIRARESAGF